MYLTDSAAARLPAGNIPLADLALFLDVDGTLLELAPVPDAVQVFPATLDLLRQLTTCTDGAVALVSGRAISTLDALFQPLRMPAAGLHGFERRNAAGGYSRHASPGGAQLERARRLLVDFTNGYPGLLLEDKEFALAVHYRAAPELAAEVERVITQIACRVQCGLEVQPGQRVMELRPAGANKGAALGEFMREPPFQGRFAVMIGDDLTDESAFHWVNSAGGLSIAVNVSHPTVATARLASVQDVHAWLHRCLAADRVRLQEFRVP
jgi:trehalose 6-phosphate phosphatase